MDFGGYLFFTALMSAISYLSHPLMILLQIMGMGVTRVEGRHSDEKVVIMKRHILKHYIFCSYMFRATKTDPCGVIVGRWFLVFTDPLNDRYTNNYYMIGSTDFLNADQGKEVGPQQPEGMSRGSLRSFTTALRIGGTYHAVYNIKTMPTFLIEFEQQMEIVASVVSLAETSERNKFGYNARCLISGPPGSGKSSVARILTERLHGVLCTEFNPSSPGDALGTLLAAADPERDNPLVVLFDEWDAVVEACRTGPLPPNKKHLRQTYDWGSLLKFLDDTAYVNNTIFLFTTNKSDEWMQEDERAAAFRRGRIDAMFYLKGVDIATDVHDVRFAGKGRSKIE